jgi:hypothetical protein
MPTPKSLTRSLNGPLAAALLGLALAACADTTGSIADVTAAGLAPAAVIGNNGNGLGNQEPISVIPTAPALQTTHAEFWAMQGKQRSVTIRYLPNPGEDEGKVFLKFTVPVKAQLVSPDGRRLARGDSLRITVNVVPGKLQADFLPQGLVFANGVPAQLDISYYYGDTRGRPTNQLGMWYLPADGASEQVYSAVDTKGWMVQGLIEHFSNYAVAYRSR